MIFALATVLLPLVPHAAGIYPATTAFLLAMPAIALLAWYRYQIAREVLGAEAGPAAGIVIFEVVLSLSVDQLLGMLLMPGAGVSA